MPTRHHDAMKLARWPGKRIHCTVDGAMTICRTLIPDTATISRDTSQWFLHTTCYNCAYRLWDTEHRPEGYHRPQNGKDFPPRPIDVKRLGAGQSVLFPRKESTSARMLVMCGKPAGCRTFL